jgi:hypothetical protein
MRYQDCCDRLGDKLSQAGPLAGPEALSLLEACVDALRAESVGGQLDETALTEHLPKLRTAIRTVWNHDKSLAVSLENRLISIMTEERARMARTAEQPSEENID